MKNINWCRISHVDENYVKKGKVIFQDKTCERPYRIWKQAPHVWKEEFIREPNGWRSVWSIEYWTELLNPEFENYINSLEEAAHE